MSLTDLDAHLIKWRQGIKPVANARAMVLRVTESTGDGMEITKTGVVNEAADFSRLTPSVSGCLGGPRYLDTHVGILAMGKPHLDQAEQMIPTTLPDPPCPI